MSILGKDILQAKNITCYIIDGYLMKNICGRAVCLEAQVYGVDGGRSMSKGRLLHFGIEI